MSLVTALLATTMIFVPVGSPPGCASLGGGTIDPVNVELRNHQLYWDNRKITWTDFAAYIRLEGDKTRQAPDAIQVFRDEASAAEARSVARIMSAAKVASWRGCSETH